MKKFYGIIAIALVLGLAACSEDSSEQKASEPAAKTEDSASKPEAAPAAQTEAPAAQSQPAPAPAATADDGAGAMDGAPEAAPADDGAGAMDGAPQAAAGNDEQACLKAVAAETSNDVVTLSVEESEANTLVMVGVGPNRAPWKCLSKDGVVAEVMSMTDEGAL
jgi:hypothetical protein